MTPERTRLVVAVVVASLAIFALGWVQGGDRVLAGSTGTDSAMRLTQAEDLLGGQAWSDLTQYRLDPPGSELHWSRHVDLALAPMLALGPGNGRALAVTIYPWALAVVSLALVALIARKIEPGTDLILILLGALTAALFTRSFLPGEVDHHSLQMVLVLAGLLSTLSPRGRGWVSGVLLGSSLAIGLDGLPAIAAVVVGTSIAWAIGAIDRGFLRGQALVLGPAAALGVLLFGAEGRLWSDACDVFSLPFLVATVIGGVGLAVTATFARPRSAGAWLGIVASGTGAGAALLVMGGRCILDGPYADLPVSLAERWLSGVSEVQPLLGIAAEQPWLGVAIAAPLVVGILSIGWRAVGRRDWSYLPYLLALLASSGVVFYQVRGALLATALAVPALGIPMEWIRRREWLTGQLTGRILALAGLLAFTGFFPLGVSALVGEAGAGRASLSLQECTSDAAMEPVDGRPPGLVLAHIDLGPGILLHTDHSVVGAPYHRATGGIEKTFDLLSGPASVDGLVEAGVDYVAICQEMGSNRLFGVPGDGTLMGALLAGEDVDGLEVVEDSGVVHLWAVGR